PRSYLSLCCSRYLRNLPSFPTRRSSDLDFHSEEQISQLMEECAREGELEILINNASNFVESNFETEGVALLDDLYKTNFKAPYLDRKSTRLNSSHVSISYAVFCLKKKKE